MSKEQLADILTHAYLWQTLLYGGFGLVVLSITESFFGLTVAAEFRFYGLAIGAACIVSGAVLKIWRTIKESQ